MSRTLPAAAAAGAVVAAAVLGVAGCTSAVSGSAITDPTAGGSTPAETTPSGAPSTSGSAPDAPAVAPFDPCTVIDWPDIIAPVDGVLEGDERPPRVITDFPGWETGCVFDDTIIVVPNPFPIDPDDPVDPNDTGRTYYFRANVLWAPECPDCAPGGPLGRDGYQDRIDRSDETAPFPSEQCDTAIELSSGYARIVLFNNKFEVDACQAATALLSTVADRVG